MKKTNVMMIKSVKTRTPSLSQSLGTKHCIKDLGVTTDEFLTWKYPCSFVCSRISRNTGKIEALYLLIQHLKQVYFNLIYPYFSYSSMVLEQSVPIRHTGITPMLKKITL